MANTLSLIPTAHQGKAWAKKVAKKADSAVSRSLRIKEDTSSLMARSKRITFQGMGAVGAGVLDTMAGTDTPLGEGVKPSLVVGGMVWAVGAWQGSDFASEIGSGMIMGSLYDYGKSKAITFKSMQDKA